MKTNSNKILAFIIALVLIVSSLPLAASADGLYDGTVNGMKYSIISGRIKYIEIDGYSGSAEKVIIPDTIENLPVQKIGYEAFIANTTVKEVVMPDTVKSIGIRAFKDCTSLVSVRFSENLTTINGAAFYSCTNLESIDLPDSLSYIDDSAFRYCSKLKSVDLPDGLQTLGGAVFGSTGITELELPESLSEISRNSFRDTNITEIVIPESINKFTEDFTLYCETLEKVVFKGDIDSMNWKTMFCGSADGTVRHYPQTLIFCKNLPIEVYGTTVTYAYNFSKIYNINRDEANGLWVLSKKDEASEPTVYSYNGSFEYTLNENGEATIVNYARYSVDYTGTYYLTVPEYFKVDGVKYPVVAIGAEAFRSRVGLKGVTIPETVKSIGAMAFEGCTSLATVNIPSGIEVVEQGVFMNTAITEIAIPSATVRVADSAFRGSGLSTVTGGENVEIIEAYGFYNSALKTPFWSEKLEEIGRYSLRATDFTDTLVLPEFLEKIGAYAFEYTRFTGIEIPETVTEIGEGAFNYNSYLLSVEIPSGVKEIGDDFFRGCSVLTSVTLKGDVTSIGERAFYECFKLSDFAIPESVEKIGFQAFESCKSLKSADIPYGVKRIASNTFYRCYALESVTVPETVESIGCSAFEECYALSGIVIPDSVKTVGERAFVNCTSLESVYMSVNIPELPMCIFQSCESLVNFEWNAPEQIVGDYAFFYCTSLKEFDFSRVVRLYYNSFWGSGITYAYIGIDPPNKETGYKAIELQTFKQCADLETVSIGSGVNEIQSEAFAECENLSTVMISDSVTSIADDAFTGSPNVTFICSEVSYAYAYASANGIPVSTFVVEAIPNQTYSGSAIRPEVRVSLKGEALEKDSDFSVSYSNNVNVGTAKVKITGRGEYNFLTTSASFTIVTRSIKTATVKDIADQKHTGKEVTPELSISYNGKKLKEGTDYKLYFYNNKEAGTATVLICGIGNFSSSTTAEFEIRSMDASDMLMNFLRSVLDFICVWLESIFIIR